LYIKHEHIEHEHKFDDDCDAEIFPIVIVIDIGFQSYF